ncbi:type I polyketide synthase [Nocardia stercoris]|uniref:Acyltransferase domain-containing protein n=1 Tax=Nocardia stercoris TaxID=2483361 RepID=A0A3M2KUH0_9NOCA|nr:type I polyketide synthase [Nocardia stercoris]RMI28100.1 acyltransferase domain-containing protein [Nocardia stercoris]
MTRDVPSSSDRYSPAGEPDAVAIVGMSCRVPGVGSPAELWELVLAGRDTIAEIPPSRFTMPGAASAAERYDLPPGSYFAEPHAFDHDFFGIEAAEAAAMDPHQRLTLELAWEAFEAADIRVSTVADSATGVFVGAISNDFPIAAARLDEASSGQALTGLNRGLIANRVSHLLGLRGPSFVVDSGQSSSLVAVHLACRSLLSGESELALAGGVHLNLALDSTLGIQRLGALSPEGRCYAFDARADGFARGEGGGLVLLKPLSRAVADGNRIHAIIRGSGVNSDGRTGTLTTPSAVAQAALVRDTQARAGVTPAEIGYVELHGTGTRVGDPVEAAALAEVFGPGRTAGRPVPVGSVKTNIGHLEGAAGILGLIKAVLSVERNVLAPSRNFHELNPDLAAAADVLRVGVEAAPWPAGGPRVAGVSSFGIGGTNCHVVVGEFAGTAGSEPAEPVPNESPAVWVVSARSDTVLRDQAARLYDRLRDRPDASLGDVAQSLLQARDVHPHRAVIIGSSFEENLDGLRSIARGIPVDNVEFGTAAAFESGPVFVFPGQGGQWAAMGRDLWETEPVFREVITDCDRELRPYVDWSLVEVLCGPEADSERVDIVQPALFAMMVGLARVWMSWGVRPAAVIGHSQGEVAAAHVAGHLSLADAVRVICARASRLGGLRPGQMVWVEAPAETATEYLAGTAVAVAAINGPRQTVISGEIAELEPVLARLRADGFRVRPVRVSRASHSPVLDEIEDALRSDMRPVVPRRGAVPMFSTLLGAWVDGAELDGDYWYRNIRQPVLFGPSIVELVRVGHGQFVEVAPHPVLGAAISDVLAGTDRPTVLAGSLSRDHGDRRELLTSAARFFAGGGAVDWLHGPLRGPAARRIELPTYAFRHHLLWPHTVGGADGDAAEWTVDELERLIVSYAVAVLGDADAAGFSATDTFKAMGLGSAQTVNLLARLGAVVGVKLAASDAFDHPTPAELAIHIRTRFRAVPTPADSLDTELADLTRRIRNAAGDRGARTRITGWLRALASEYGAGDDSTANFDVVAASEDELLDFIDSELRGDAPGARFD